MVGDATRAGHALFALLVDDLEDQVAALAQRGLATGEIETAPGVVRKVVLSDPEGDRITVGEEPQHKRLRSPRSRERRLIYVSPAHVAPQGWPTPTSVMFSGRTARIPA